MTLKQTGLTDFDAAQQTSTTTDATNDAPDTVGDHTVEYRTDAFGDELVVCTDCGDSALPGSEHHLADYPCDPDAEFNRMTLDD